MIDLAPAPAHTASLLVWWVSRSATCGRPAAAAHIGNFLFLFVEGKGGGGGGAGGVGGGGGGVSLDRLGLTR